MLTIALISYASFCYGIAAPFVAWMGVNKTGMDALSPREKAIVIAFIITAPVSFPVALYFVNMLSKVEFKPQG
jgi:hypothetical protein